MRGNLQLVKEINAAVILNLLHQGQRLSRAEIAAETQLSAATVSALVESLREQGLIEEIGERPSAGAGRPAIALQIRSNGGYVIGLALGNGMLRSALLDLCGNVIATFTELLAEDGEVMAAQVEQAIRGCMEKAVVMDAGTLKGIGISIPGIVDEQGETMIRSNQLQLANYPLRHKLAAHYPGIPIRLVNDSNAAALAEHYNGAGSGCKHLLYFTIQKGIGSGIVLNGQVMAGYRGAAGEIGHLPDLTSGLPASGTELMSLEDRLSAPHVLSRCKEAAKAQGLTAPDSLEEALERYAAGEAGIVAVLNPIRRAIALMIASAASMLSPEAVVIDGWFAGSSFFTAALVQDYSHWMRGLAAPAVLLSSYGDKGPLYGAASVMLQQVFRAAAWA